MIIRVNPAGKPALYPSLPIQITRTMTGKFLKSSRPLGAYFHSNRQRALAYRPGCV
jgi:hypothetical protein